MAKLTVYIPDELAADIKRLGDRMNASRVCREALTREVKIMSLITDDNLARLRAARLRDTDVLFEEGREAGVDWAANAGSYRQVRAIATFATANPGWTDIRVDGFGIGWEGRDADVLRKADRWCAGFVAGVVQVYTAISN